MDETEPKTDFSALPPLTAFLPVRPDSRWSKAGPLTRACVGAGSPGPTALVCGWAPVRLDYSLVCLIRVASKDNDTFRKRSARVSGFVSVKGIHGHVYVPIQCLRHIYINAIATRCIMCSRSVNRNTMQVKKATEKRETAPRSDSQ